jgi:SulP family sulfate permease
MLVILVVFAGLVGQVAMPTLAAVLIFAAVGALRPHQLATIWRTGRLSQIAIAGTFVATLFLPVAAAVGVGVVLSLMLQLNQEAMDLTVVELVPTDDHQFRQQSAPSALPSHRVTILDVYGSLFYAGSRTLEAMLPDPSGAVDAAVVLRLRGRTSLGSTFFTIVAAYSKRLADGGGRLYLTGIEPALSARLHRDGGRALTGSAVLYDAAPVLGASTLAALHDAETWVIAHEDT